MKLVTEDIMAWLRTNNPFDWTVHHRCEAEKIIAELCAETDKLREFIEKECVPDTGYEKYDHEPDSYYVALNLWESEAQKLGCFGGTDAE